jgi:cytoskeletal protein RodZ
LLLLPTTRTTTAEGTAAAAASEFCFVLLLLMAFHVEKTMAFVTNTDQHNANTLVPLPEAAAAAAPLPVVLMRLRRRCRVPSSSSSIMQLSFLLLLSVASPRATLAWLPQQPQPFLPKHSHDRMSVVLLVASPSSENNAKSSTLSVQEMDVTNAVVNAFENLTDQMDQKDAEVMQTLHDLSASFRAWAAAEINYQQICHEITQEEKLETVRRAQETFRQQEELAYRTAVIYQDEIESELQQLMGDIQGGYSELKSSLAHLMNSTTSSYMNVDDENDANYYDYDDDDDDDGEEENKTDRWDGYH